LATKWCFDPDEDELLSEALSEGFEDEPLASASTTPLPSITLPLIPSLAPENGFFTPNLDFSTDSPFLPAVDTFLATEGPNPPPEVNILFFNQDIYVYASDLIYMGEEFWAGKYVFSEFAKLNQILI
jgi:hypothetical protein